MNRHLLAYLMVLNSVLSFAVRRAMNDFLDFNIRF